MARNTSKTPAQIAQELQARATAAAIRAAKSEAQDNPMMAQIQALIDSTNKSIAGFARKLSGKNSFDNRVKSAELRLDWIRAEQALTIAENKLQKVSKDYLQHSMAGLAVKIADGEAVGPNEVNEIINNLPTDPNMAELAFRETETKNAWRDFVAANDGETETQVATA